MALAAASLRVARYSAAPSATGVSRFRTSPKKEKRLFGACAILARHSREHGIDFGEAMRGGESALLLMAQEHGEARVVVFMIAVKGRHEDGCIQKVLHDRLSRSARSRVSRLSVVQASCCRRGTPKRRVPSAAANLHAAGEG
jgi:hypothetical protein